MDNEKPIVDFGAIRDALGKDFEPVQVLDGQAKVIKPEIVSKYSNEQLVEFFKLMLWERTLHQRSNALTRQGRLGFYAPTEGQEASEMGSNAAMKKTDVLMPAYRDIPQLIQHGLPVYKAFLWSRGHVLEIGRAHV